MIQCSICPLNFNDPQAVCAHIRKHHSGINAYRCTICNRAVFTELWKYKRHLINVCKLPLPNLENSEDIPAKLYPNHMSEFEKTVDECALSFVCNLASKMNTPRNLTYEIVSEVQRFNATTILKGFDQYVMPNVRDEAKSNVASFIQICREPFRSVNTENKLDSLLQDKKLTSSLIPFEITSETQKDLTSKPKCGVLMPLAFQLKKFFELPGVFELTQQFAKEVSKDHNISHFLNASAWKEKLKSYSVTDNVIPFHLHIDDTQVNNALGSHRSKGLETCCYYSLPSIPPQYGSRLENIFPAQLFPSTANKQHGNLPCFNKLIDELNQIAQEPIILNIDGREEKVYFALGLVLGDNKGINDVGGFAKSHKAKYFCRICTLSKKQTEVRVTQDNSKMRNPENYDQDLKKNDPKLTGIVENSIVNLILLCHATISFGVDIMHDLFEGILHYNLSAIIIQFIKDGYFTLDTLNKLISDFEYGEGESCSKPPPLTMKKLKSKKLLMSASEMHVFFHHFGLIVGDLIHKTDKTWKFFIETTKVLDLIFLPFYTENDLSLLASTIASMNSMYKKLFNETLKPKHHYVTHYPTMIRRFGPLYAISSMRFEAKHKTVKTYTKNTTCRLNLSSSLGRKLQYSFAFRILSNTGLKDSVIVGSSNYINLQRSDTFQILENPHLLQHFLNKNTKETVKVSINGICFSKKLYFLLHRDTKVILCRIVKIIYLKEELSDIFFIYEEFSSVSFNRNYQCYDVDTSHRVDTLKTISAVDVLRERQHPVFVQVVKGNNNFRFRAKRF